MNADDNLNAKLEAAAESGRRGKALLRKAATKMQADSQHMAGLGDEISIFTLATGKWLRGVVRFSEMNTYPADHYPLWDEALAVARAYLGRDA